MDIGKRIKCLRVKFNMTQDELGEKLGVKKAAIQKYENGSIVNLKMETINKLAEIFKVDPNYLMGWEKFDKQIDMNRIKKEIRLAELISDVFEEDKKFLIFKAFELNEEGQEKLFSYINDLIELDKYID